MAYIGRTKTPAPLTSADIPDGIVTAADLAPDSVGTSEIADSVTLVTPNIGTPSAGVVTNLSGVLPVGVTGGSGLTAVSPTNLTSGMLGATERTSLTSPSTITATCTSGDTLDAAGSLGSGDLFDSSAVNIFGTNQTAAGLTFDYGSGITKYLRYIEWYNGDGGGNSTGIKIRGSDNGTSWTDITTVTSAIFNGAIYKVVNTGTTAYRYWQIYWTWSSGNWISEFKSLKIHESDVSTITTISPSVSLNSDVKELDWWQLTASATGNINPITTNFGRVLSGNFVHVGKGMTESSGVFTFPSTGMWEVQYRWTGWTGTASTRYARATVQWTPNTGTNWYDVGYTTGGQYNYTDNTEFNLDSTGYITIRDVSTDKVRFYSNYENQTTYCFGKTPSTTSSPGTSFIFKRLGDT